MRFDPLRTGAAVGAIFGVWHLAWAALVAFGVAKALLDFLLWLHFLSLSIELAPFDIGRAVLLVAFTAGVGGGLGALFALVWNGFQPVAMEASAEFIGIATIESPTEGRGSF